MVDNRQKIEFLVGDEFYRRLLWDKYLENQPKLPVGLLKNPPEARKIRESKDLYS